MDTVFIDETFQAIRVTIIITTKGTVMVQIRLLAGSGESISPDLKLVTLDCKDCDKPCELYKSSNHTCTADRFGSRVVASCRSQRCLQGT